MRKQQAIVVRTQRRVDIRIDVKTVDAIHYCSCCVSLVVVKRYTVNANACAIALQQLCGIAGTASDVQNPPTT
ncbi:MAG: hypothetical protein AAF654_08340 [Myxococcota bacterium]